MRCLLPGSELLHVLRTDTDKEFMIKYMAWAERENLSLHYVLFHMAKLVSLVVLLFSTSSDNRHRRCHGTVSARSGGSVSGIPYS